MLTLSRRSFLAGVAATIPFSLWFEKYASAAVPVIRYGATTPQGKAMLVKYAKAVAKMKTIAGGTPNSWIFQWYTHSVFTENGIKQTQAELRRLYSTVGSPYRNLAQEMWNTCQAHSPGDDENFFLPWHRMYVYFFERIVRKIIDDPTFTLPYWNYSVSGAAHGVLPIEFRSPNSPNLAPLYVDKRNSGVNDGQPMAADGPGSPFALTALRECFYKPNETESGFCQSIDSPLHGNVHVEVGNTRNMGSVPWAAGDPVFWAHHCNIDRLWASWNRAGRQNPADDGFLNQPFIFADENGIKVEAKVKDFLDISALGYSYDRFEQVPACPTPTTSLLATPLFKTKTVTTVGEDVKLGSSAVRVALEPTAALLSNPSANTFPKRLLNLKPVQRIFLVVRNIRTNVDPGVTYNLFLDIPANVSIAGAKSHLVGTINFFGAGHHASDNPEEVTTLHAKHNVASQKFISFDITNIVKNFQGRRVLKDMPSLTIAPRGTPDAEAQPIIGEITIIER